MCVYMYVSNVCDMLACNSGEGNYQLENTLIRYMDDEYMALLVSTFSLNILLYKNQIWSYFSASLQ